MQLGFCSTFTGCRCIAGQTLSEGGFKRNQVSAVSVLDYGPKEKDGKTYYQYELLSRTGTQPSFLQPEAHNRLDRQLQHLGNRGCKAT